MFPERINLNKFVEAYILGKEEVTLMNNYPREEVVYKLYPGEYRTFSLDTGYKTFRYRAVAPHKAPRKNDFVYIEGIGLIHNEDFCPYEICCMNLYKRERALIFSKFWEALVSNKEFAPIRFMR